MEVPNQYPYSPPLRLILLFFDCGFLWIAVDWLPWGHMPTRFRFWFSPLGIIPIALAFISGVFRISFETYLSLHDDGLVLPIAYSRCAAWIEYTSIRRVWRHYLRPCEYAFVLKLATERGPLPFGPPFFQTTRANVLWKSS